MTPADAAVAAVFNLTDCAWARPDPVRSQEILEIRRFLSLGISAAAVGSRKLNPELLPIAQALLILFHDAVHSILPLPSLHPPMPPLFPLFLSLLAFSVDLDCAS